MKKKWPRMKTDGQAEKLLERDLTGYLDRKNFDEVSFELLPKSKQVNIRFPEELLSAVQKEAKRRGISYQKYIRKAVEESLAAR